MIDTSRVHFESSAELCRYMAEETGGTALLAFSCGKDSICSWIQMRRYFARVIPIYRYIVPGLRFVEESLSWYEDHFQTRIHRVPNASFYWMLRDGTFQSPIRREGLATLKMSWAYTDEREGMQWVEDNIRERLGCEDAYKGVGLRASDSITRRTSIRKHGVVQHSEDHRAFFPIFDWKTEDMVRALEDDGCKLPVDYRLWNRSFDSTRARFMPALRQHYPDDYELIRAWFPLIDADEQRRKYFYASKEELSATTAEVGPGADSDVGDDEDIGDGAPVAGGGEGEG